MKLKELKTLSEWRTTAGFSGFSDEDISNFLDQATKSKYVISAEYLSSYLKLSSDQLIYIIHNKDDKWFGYSVFERLYEEIFKRDIIFTKPEVRKQNLQVELLGRCIQEQKILVCNGDSLSPDEARFWLRISQPDLRANFTCKIFDFKNHRYVDTPEIKPEDDASNQFRYIVGIKVNENEKYLTGHSLFEHSEHPLLKNTMVTMYAMYGGVDFDFD